MFSLPKWRSIVPSFTLTTAPAVAKNGLPRINGSWASSPISSTTKSVGISYLPIFTGRSSKMPTGYFTERSANTRESLHFLYWVNPSFFATDKGIKLTLAPKSQRLFSNTIGPRAQGSVKLPGSSNFSGTSSLWMMALHSWVRIIMPSISFFFAATASFKNLLYWGINIKASMMGIATWASLICFSNRALYFSSSCFLNLPGNGSLGS